jgi:hypothetical protein
MAYEIRIEKSKGYERSGNRSYLAQITGLCPQYGLSREFLEPARTEWPKDFAWGRKKKATRVDVYSVEEGIYERAEEGDKDYVMVSMKDGQLVHTIIGIGRVREIARMLDAGEDFEAARVASKSVAG